MLVGCVEVAGVGCAESTTLADDVEKGEVDDRERSVCTAGAEGAGQVTLTGRQQRLIVYRPVGCGARGALELIQLGELHLAAAVQQEPLPQILSDLNRSGFQCISIRVRQESESIMISNLPFRSFHASSLSCKNFRCHRA